MTVSLGQAGERTSGKRDSKTEAWLPVLQGLLRMGVDVLGVLVLVVMSMAVGRVGVYVASGLAALLAGEPVRRWLMSYARTRAMRSVAHAIGSALPWLWLAGGWAVVWFLMPFKWEVDLETQEHMLALTRGAERVVKVAPVIRVIALGIGGTVLGTVGVLRRHFKNELDAFYPMAAVDPSEKGADPRGWAARVPVEDVQVTVRMEMVRRRDEDNIGQAALRAGDEIAYGEIRATERQWQSLAMVARRDDLQPTESQMMRDGIFAQSEWRRVRGELVNAGLMEAGGRGVNAGYGFTQEGEQFFRERRWRG